MFIFGSQYSDIATLTAKSEYTLKSAYDLAESLSHRIALEAVMRVLASKGRRISGFYGNSYVQSSNLLSLLNVPRDKSYTTEVSFEASLTIPTTAIGTVSTNGSGGHHRHGRMQGSRVWHELKLDDARDALTNRRVEILGATSNLQISVLGMFQHVTNLGRSRTPRNYSQHARRSA
ncbi:COPII subunit [Mortierella sp. GBA43]|nr:COPII subunit [Mortierella sp. GBA43]